jgi:3-oxoacyl-[acyl-carrier protein] reductase
MDIHPLDLHNKTAVVTGAGKGIGKATAIRLAVLAASVIVADLVENEAREAAIEINSLGNGRATAVAADVSKPEDAEKIIELCVEEFGNIDILVNNAGITNDGLLVRMKKEQWDQVLDVNLTGTFLCTQAAFKRMMRQRSGAIVNIASIAGERGNFGQTNYAASKAGVIGFTKSVAREGASRNIRCNAVAPGLIKTRLTDAMPDKIRDDMVSSIPLGRIGSPEDVANGVAFLVTDNASYITGIVLDINGGGHLV